MYLSTDAYLNVAYTRRHTVVYFDCFMVSPGLFSLLVRTLQSLSLFFVFELFYLFCQRTEYADLGCHCIRYYNQYAELAGNWILTSSLSSAQSHFSQAQE